MRIGAKKTPFYRVVAVDERSKRTGGYIELLGTYNPLTEPKDIKLKQDRIDYWTAQGAQPSTGFLRIIGKAPQRPPRKPKKEKPAEAPAAKLPTEQPITTEQTTEQPAEEASKEAETAEAPAEEATEETPQEEVKSESAEPAATEESENKNEGSA